MNKIFNEVFFQGLELMLQGMAGIFIVLIFIYFSIKILGALFPED